MKARTLLLAGLSMMAFTAFAQEEEEYEKDLTTLQFVDKQGNVIEDGSMITLTDVNLENPMPEVNSGLSVKNTTAEDVECNVDFEVLYIDNGSLNCCFPANCATPKTEPGLYSTEYGPIAAGSTIGFQTEWQCETYGACKTTFQLYIWGQTLLPGQFTPTLAKVKAGPKITVNFVYNDPAAINGVTNDGAAHAVAFYNANGQQISKLESGLNIIRYSNGKTVKTVIK